MHTYTNRQFKFSRWYVINSPCSSYLVHPQRDMQERTKWAPKNAIHTGFLHAPETRWSYGLGKYEYKRKKRKWAMLYFKSRYSFSQVSATSFEQMLAALISSSGRQLPIIQRLHHNSTFANFSLRTVGGQRFLDIVNNLRTDQRTEDNFNRIVSFCKKNCSLIWKLNLDQATALVEDQCVWT